MIIELSDTALSFDREVKAPLYARRGVAETWIVDLRNDRLLRFGRATADRDATVSEIELTSCSIDALPGVTIDLAPLRSSRI